MTARFFTCQNHRNYIESTQNQQIFTDLAYHINVVQLEDSLQYIALLPENERALIQNIIQKEIDKERRNKKSVNKDKVFLIKIQEITTISWK